MKCRKLKKGVPFSLFIAIMAASMAMSGCKKKSNKSNAMESLLDQSVAVETSIDQTELYNMISTNGDILSLDGKFTEDKITDDSTALQALVPYQNILGLTDVTKELTFIQSYDVNGQTWYRFTQTFQDYPVFGKAIVVQADAQGEALGVWGNTASMEGAPTKASMSESDAKAKLSSGFGDNEQIGDSMGMQYYASDDGIHLCYCYLVAGENETDGTYVNQVLLDGNNGEIMTQKSELQSIQKDVEVTGLKDKSYTITADYDNSTYTLVDGTRNISYYIPKTEKEKALNGQVANPNDTSKDAKRRRNGTTITDLTDMNEMKAITWNQSDPLPKEYADGVHNISTAYDYFNSHWQITPTIVSPLHVVFNMQRYKSLKAGEESKNVVKTAFHLFDVKLGHSYLIFGKTNNMSHPMCDDIDLSAHEFTHSIVCWTGGMSGYEGGAINEAYADVFGEIIQKSSTGSVDWKNRVRNIKKPATGFITNYSDYKPKMNIYNASTIVSHMLYTMTVGVDGNSALSTEELAQLMYRTMLLIPNEVTFEDLAFTMEATAVKMVQDGTLSESQQKTVDAAFKTAGILPSKELFRSEVNGTAILSLHNSAGELIHGFQLNIHGMKSAESPSSIRKLTNEQYKDEIIVDEDKKVELELPTGFYRVDVIDLKTNKKGFGYLSVSQDKNVKQTEKEIDVNLSEFKIPVDFKVVDEEEKSPIANCILTDTATKLMVPTDAEGNVTFYLERLHNTVLAAANGYTSDQTILERSDVEADEVIEIPLKKSELLNNGGSYVSYSGNTYYWEYSNGCMSTDPEIFAYYNQKTNVNNTLYCQKSDGTKEEIVQAPGKDGIYIVGENIIWQECGENANIRLKERCLNAETDDFVYTLFDDYGWVCGLDDVNGCVILQYNDGIYSVNCNTRKMKCIVEHAHFVAIDGDTLYYEPNRNDYNSSDTCIYSIKTNKKQKKKLASFVGDITGLCNGYYFYETNAQVTDHYVYFSSGGYAGTGNFFQGGQIMRISKDTGKLEILAGSESNPTTEYFWGDKEDTTLHYASSYDENVTVIRDLASGSESNEDGAVGLAIVPFTDFKTGNVYTNNPKDNKRVQLLSASEIAGLGYSEKIAVYDEMALCLKNAEVVGDMFYFTLEESKHDPQNDVGWRYSYTCVKRVVYQKDMKTNIITELYQY